jgi:hypothetical protein
MKKLSYIACFLILLPVVAGCASESRHHKTSLPDPASFNAHFGDMDLDGDDYVNWEEFKAYFSQATPDIFKALDLNEDNQVDHDEWHDFKEAHGMRHHD